MISGCSGITDEPDLTVVSLESSQTPSLKEVIPDESPDKHGSSLMSFEGQERCLTTDSNKNVKKDEPSNTNSNANSPSPKRLSWDPQFTVNTGPARSSYHPAVSSSGNTGHISAVSIPGFVAATSAVPYHAPCGHRVVTVPCIQDAEQSTLSDCTLSQDQSVLLSTARITPLNKPSQEAAPVSESDLSEDLSHLRRALETSDDDPDGSGTIPGTSDMSSVFGSETSEGEELWTPYQ